MIELSVDRTIPADNVSGNNLSSTPVCFPLTFPPSSSASTLSPRSFFLSLIFTFLHHQSTTQQQIITIFIYSNNSSTLYRLTVNLEKFPHFFALSEWINNELTKEINKSKNDKNESKSDFSDCQYALVPMTSSLLSDENFRSDFDILLSFDSSSAPSLPSPKLFFNFPIRSKSESLDSMEFSIHHSSGFLPSTINIYGQRIQHLVTQLFNSPPSSSSSTFPPPHCDSPPVSSLSLTTPFSLLSPILPSELSIISQWNIGSQTPHGQWLSIVDNVMNQLGEKDKGDVYHMGSVYDNRKELDLSYGRVMLQSLALSSYLLTHYPQIILSPSSLSSHCRHAILAQCIDRSPYQIVGMMAIQLLHCAYVPFNVMDPVERLEFLCGDVGVEMVMSTRDVEEEKWKNIKGKVEGKGKKLIVISHDSEEIQKIYSGANALYDEMKREGRTHQYVVGVIEKKRKELLDFKFEWNDKSNTHSPSLLPLLPRSTCFLLYTSGSTGIPKCLQLTHSGFHHSFKGYNDHLNTLVSREMKTIQTANSTFDLHSIEIYGVMMGGGTIIQLKPKGNLDMEYYSRMIEGNGATCIQLVPSLLLTLLEYLILADCKGRMSSLQWIICAGERLPPSLVNTINKEFITDSNVKCRHLKMINKMGPAECCIDALHHVVDFPTDSLSLSIPIGVPLPNYSAYVVHPDTCRLLPIGSIGELVIGGPGVMNGYINRDELNQKVFLHGVEEEIKLRKKAIDNGLSDGREQFSGISLSSPLYRTGDLVQMKWNEKLQKYEMIHCGRSDFQVKLRGQRLEVGEIESCILTGDERVSNVCVVARQDGQFQYLCAFIVGKNNINMANVDVKKWKSELKSLCQKKLVSYMVPHRMIFLPSLPKNNNGKVDRKVLMNMKLDDIENDADEEEKKVPGETNDSEGEKKIDDNTVPPHIDSRIVTIVYIAWATVLLNLRYDSSLLSTTLSSMSSPSSPIPSLILPLRISFTRDFFSVGGNSLSAMTILSLIHNHLANKMQMEIFGNGGNASGNDKGKEKGRGRLSLQEFLEGGSIMKICEIIMQKINENNSNESKSNSSSSISPSSSHKRGIEDMPWPSSTPLLVDGIASYAQQRVYFDEKIRFDMGDEEDESASGEAKSEKYSLYNCYVSFSINNKNKNTYDPFSLPSFHLSLSSLIHRHSSLRTVVYHSSSTQLITQRIISLSSIINREKLYYLYDNKEISTVGQMENKIKKLLYEPFPMRSEQEVKEREKKGTVELLFRCHVFPITSQLLSTISITPSLLPAMSTILSSSSASSASHSTAYFVLFVIHHLVFDGLSGHVMMREIKKFYEFYYQRERQGKGKSNNDKEVAFSATLYDRCANAISLAPLSLHYIDYSRHEYSYFSTADPSSAYQSYPALKEAEDYWRSQMSNIMNTKYEFNIPPPPSSSVPISAAIGGYHHFSLVHSPTTSHYFSHLSLILSTYRITLFQFMFSVFSLFLSLISKTECSEFFIGVINGNHYREEMNEIIGFFANTLPIRATVSYEMVMESFILSCKNNINKAFTHGNFPYNRIVQLGQSVFKKEMGDTEQPFPSPLFKCFLGFKDGETAVGEVMDIEGTDCQWITRSVDEIFPMAKFDFSLNVGTKKNKEQNKNPSDTNNIYSEITFEFDYSAALFHDKSLLDIFSKRFMFLLEQILDSKNLTYHFPSLAKQNTAETQSANPFLIPSLSLPLSSYYILTPSDITAYKSKYLLNQIPSLVEKDIYRKERESWCIHHMLYKYGNSDERQRKHVAIILDEETVSYEELLWKVHHLASWILKHPRVIKAKKNLPTNVNVVISQYVDRSTEMFIGIFAMYAAGCSYCPIDVNLPDERVEYMLYDTQSVLIFTMEDVRGKLEKMVESGKKRSRDINPNIGTDAPQPEIVLFSSISYPPLPSSWTTLTPPIPTLNPSSIAYLIYTSGSTGRAKSIQLSHTNFLGITLNFHVTSPIPIYTKEEVALNTAGCAFDAHVQETVGTICAGATCVMLHPGGQLDSEYIIEYCEKVKMTFIAVVPSLCAAIFSTIEFQISSLMSSLPPSSLSSEAKKQKQKLEITRKVLRPFLTLRILTTAGEALKPQLVHQWYQYIDILHSYSPDTHPVPPVPLLNLYGPGECSDCTTYHFCTREEGQSLHLPSLPIGYPFPFYDVYMLSTSSQQLIPITPYLYIGELFIGGRGVMEGNYLNNEEQNKKAIFSYKNKGENKENENQSDVHPIFRQMNYYHHRLAKSANNAEFPLVTGKIYKSGDLVTPFSSSGMTFVGRSDFQVKIRGQRLEVEEIESVVNNDSKVENCIVVKREEKGNQFLAGFVQFKTTVSPSSYSLLLTSSIIPLCKSKLSPYMVPTIFYPLKQLPLNVNGKVDRKVLMGMKLEGVEGVSSGSVGGAEDGEGEGEDGPQEDEDETKGNADDNEEEKIQIKVEEVKISSSSSVSASSSSPISHFAMTPLQHHIASIWSTVLSLPFSSISPTKSFLAYGGSSLQAMSVISHLRNDIWKGMSIAILFQNATVEKLAKAMVIGMKKAGKVCPLSNEIAGAKKETEGKSEGGGKSKSSIHSATSTELSSVSSPPSASASSSSPSPSVSDPSSPSTPLERKIAEVWSIVLSLPLSSINKNKSFLVYGGTSLQAMSIISQLRQSVIKTISISTLFQNPTVKKLALAIEKLEKKGTAAPNFSNKEDGIAIAVKGDEERKEAPSLNGIIFDDVNNGVVSSSSSVNSGHSPKISSSQPLFMSNGKRKDSESKIGKFSPSSRGKSNGVNDMTIPLLSSNENFGEEEDSVSSKSFFSNGNSGNNSFNSSKSSSGPYHHYASTLSDIPSVSSPSIITPFPSHFTVFQHIYSTYVGRIILEFISVSFQICLFAASIGVPYYCLELIEDIPYVDNWFNEDNPSAWSLFLGYNMEIVVMVLGGAIFRLISFVVLKWLVIGRMKEGTYNLYSFYMYRYQFVISLWAANGILWPFMEGSVLMTALLRLLGSKIGSNTVLNTVSFEGFDLIEIGDDCFIGEQVVLHVAFYQPHINPSMSQVTFAKIQIGDQTSLVSNVVVQVSFPNNIVENPYNDMGRVQIGHRCLVKPYSVVSGIVPPCSIWSHHAIVSETKSEDNNDEDDDEKNEEKSKQEEITRREYSLLRTVPYSGGDRGIIKNTFQIFFVLFIMIISIQPISVLTMIWFEYLDPLDPDMYDYLYYFLLPIWYNLWAALSAITICIPLLSILSLPCFRISPGKYPIHSWSFLIHVWCRNIILSFNEDNFMIFAYTPAQKYLLRSLGAKIGERVEMADPISSVKIPFYMLEMRAGSFTTGGVSLGSIDVINGLFVLEYGGICMDEKSFVGNRSLISQPTKIESNALVGALSYLPPFSHAKKGEVRFGIPATTIPIDYNAGGETEKSISAPKLGQQESTHAFARVCSVLLGHLIGDLLLAIAIAGPLLPPYLFVDEKYFTDENVLLFVPVIYIGMCINLFFLCIFAKIMILGYEIPSQHPFGGMIFHQQIVYQLVMDRFDQWVAPYICGTEFTNIFARGQGAKIGNRVICCGGVANLVNYDLMTVGDSCILDTASLIQPHTFEKRWLKLDNISMGSAVYMGPDAFMFPGSQVGDNARILPFTLIMRGEQIPERTTWRGNPAENMD